MRRSSHGSSRLFSFYMWDAEGGWYPDRLEQDSWALMANYCPLGTFILALSLQPQSFISS